MQTYDIFNLAVVGIDICKEVFHLVGFDGDGNLVLCKKIKRLDFILELEKFPHCIVGMEACLSTRFINQTLRKLGFEPQIIPAKYTRPFIKGQQNDYNDAAATVEAALSPNLPCVEEKTQDLLDLRALHRMRLRSVSRCLTTINQIRAFLIEHGIIIRTGTNMRSEVLCSSILTIDQMRYPSA